MEHVDKKTKNSKIKPSKNSAIRMIEDKERIVDTLKKGRSLSTLKGIKIVCPA